MKSDVVQCSTSLLQSNVKCGPWFIILVTVRYRLKWHLAQKRVHSVLGKWNVVTVELAICVARWTISAVGSCCRVAWRGLSLFYTFLSPGLFQSPNGNISFHCWIQILL